MRNASLYQKVASPGALPVSLLVTRAQDAIESLSSSFGEYLRERVHATYRLHLKFLRSGDASAREEYLAAVTDIRTSAETASYAWPARFAMRLEQSLNAAEEPDGIPAALPVQMDALLLSTQPAISEQELQRLDRELSRL